MWKSTSVSGAPDNSSRSHFFTMTWPRWLRRAVRNRHRHAIEQASRRWRGGTHRKILISTQAATEINGRKHNAVGKETLPLIVCASLVDKAPNLAGLARTCEVFACEQLIVADPAITSKKEFQQIASTSAEINQCVRPA